uniref:Front-end desaturase 1 n=1 Tax=Tigriopus californicus TaxID=6832 RepID=A0A8E8LHR2_TIGCA|nr:front-end desaturase 1 [Tigriopus californicus]
MSATKLAADQILVEGKVYSSTKLADLHPGGPLFLRAFSGRDATQAFLSYHRRTFPHSRVKEAFEHHHPDVVYDPATNADYLELCERIDKVIPRMKSFAPWSYFIKATLIWSTAIGLEIHMHYNASYPWFETALLGFFFALMGLNVQHDANHGSLSRKPWVNRFWGLAQNWYGGSSVSWIHQHVVQHHIHTNDVFLDPDIEGKSPILRLNPNQPLLKAYAFQHVHYFLLILVFGYNIIYQAVTTVLEFANKAPFSVLLRPYILGEHIWNVFFVVRWFLLPIVLAPSLWTPLTIMPMFMVFGTYLSFFFHISHNFDGVEQLEDTSSKNSFLYNQLITSSNVCGAKLCFLNGGLNYQIEHHLFPRMHHSHYPTVAPHVRNFCEEKGLPYHHFPTIRENLSSCINHLSDFGRKEVPRAAEKLDIAKRIVRNIS